MTAKETNLFADFTPSNPFQHQLLREVLLATGVGLQVLEGAVASDYGDVRGRVGRLPRKQLVGLLILRLLLLDLLILGLFRGFGFGFRGRLFVFLVVLVAALVVAPSSTALSLSSRLPRGLAVRAVLLVLAVLFVA